MPIKRYLLTFLILILTICLFSQVNTTNFNYQDNNKKYTTLLMVIILLALTIIVWWSYNTKIKLVKSLTLQKEKIEQQALQLEQSNAAKDKLFTIIAHDLRSPINAYMGMALMLNHLIEKKQFVDVKLLLQELEDTSLHLSVLINNLLQWSLPQQLQFTIEAINTATFLKKITPIYHKISKNKDIEFFEELQEDVMINSSKSHLGIIVRNLLDNAVKHSVAQSEIVVESYFYNENFYLKISNSCNNNIDISKIKELFSSATKWDPGHAGMGIGMILIQQSVITLNGKMDVGVKNNMIYFELKLKK